MNHDFETTTRLAVELTEEFLAKFASYSGLIERRRWRKQALPYVLGYLQYDGMVGMEASACLFRLTLQEHPTAFPGSKEKAEQVVALFAKTPEFTSALLRMDLRKDTKPHSDELEFEKYLVKYLENERKGETVKYNLFENKLTAAQDDINHAILMEIAKKLSATPDPSYSPIGELHAILQHAHECQCELTQVSVPTPTSRSKMG